MQQRRSVILPNAANNVLGLFGGGQLGRMFAQAAARLGYRVHVFVPDAHAPAVEVAWRHTRASYADLDAVTEFAKHVAAVTFEFENVPVTAVQEAAKYAPVSPQPHVLEITQHRAREKSFLQARGLPVTPFALIHSEADIANAVQSLGTPAVIKSIHGGYDGKGQQKITDPAQVHAAWRGLADPAASTIQATTREALAVVEAWVDFTDELSVIVARTHTGQTTTYGPIRNVHKHHILDHSVFPAGFSRQIEKDAIDIAHAVVEAFDLIGVCCIEMFLTKAGQLLINEIAPRPHNSGHLTIEAHQTSQYEQQVRTMCNLPLGSSTPRTPAAAMANLLGDLWLNPTTPPDWTPVLASPDVTLHLYGKTYAEPGRKMGHITACGTSPQMVTSNVINARQRLRPA